MVHVSEITSWDAPELLPYRTMKGQCDHERQGIFVAEGEKVVRRLLESDLEVVSVLLPPKWLEDLRPLMEQRPEMIQAFVAEKPFLEKLTGFSMYQGVLGLGRIPRPATLDTLIKKGSRPLLMVAVEGLSNAENMGAVIRNSVAFGAQGLIVGETNCHPYLRRSVRGSMGTIFKMPYACPPSLVEALGELRSRQIQTIAAHPHAGGKTLSQANLCQDTCVVLGAEGTGLSSKVLAACAETVAAPMQGGVDSLNVGAATAVFFHEAARQRGLA